MVNLLQVLNCRCGRPRGVLTYTCAHTCRSIIGSGLEAFGGQATGDMGFSEPHLHR